MSDLASNYHEWQEALIEQYYAERRRTRNYTIYSCRNPNLLREWVPHLPPPPGLDGKIRAIQAEFRKGKRHG